MTLFLALILAGVASFCLTWVLRRYAIARRLIDVPNTRSSHVVPTPRGGGVAIVVVFGICVLVAGFMALVSWKSLFGVIGAGGIVALVGFLDDHGDVAARWRLLWHTFAAVWALSWMGGMPSLELFGYSLDLSWLGHCVAVIYLVWLLNLYNFMDGIDGIASLEAIFVASGGALIYILYGDMAMALMPLFLTAAVAGFLCWNFPPARIFMGDAGSGFIGMVLGVFSLQAAWTNPDFLWAWLILLGVFIVDATLTLLRRFMRGERVYEAHRSHGYQYASRAHGSHRAVTLSVFCINVVWLLPLALIVAAGGVNGLLGLVIAYAPLVWLAFKYNAGSIEDPRASCS